MARYREVGDYGKLSLITAPAGPPVTTGLQLWVDAKDESSFTYGVNPLISQWNDKSTSVANGTQANPSFQPTRITDGVRYNASAFLNSTVPSDTKPLTVFVVATDNGNNSERTILGNVGGSGFVLKYYFTAAIRSSYDGIVDLGDSSSMPPTLVKAQFNFTYSAANVWAYRINRTNAGGGTTAATPVAGATTQIGARNNGTSMNSDLHELLKYTRVLTAQEILDVENYLKTKWNLP